MAPTRDAVVGYFRPRFGLGLTATPLRADGKDIYTYYDDVTALSIPLERALVEGLLTPIDYKVISDRINPDLVAELLRGARRKEANYFTPRVDREIARVVLDEAEQIPGGARILIFCNRVEEMERLASLFPDSRTISGDNNRDEQLEIVAAFARGDFSILLAVDVLNEGIDIPDVNLLVFFRNTVSPVVFLQQLGRGLRKSPGKDVVKVLDFANNIERFEFVYSLFSRIRAERASRVAAGDNVAHESSLDLDDIAKDVIEALIQKKEDAGHLVDLQALNRGLDNRFHPNTFLHLIRRGRLVPDFTIGHPAKHYFERATYERFLRLVHSAHSVENLIHESEFARVIGRSVRWLKDQERHGAVSPTWFHRIGSSQKWVFFYTMEDLHEVQGRIR